MFKNILLPIDIDDSTAWPRTASVAATMSADGAEVHIVNVVPDFGTSLVGSFFPDGFEKKALEEAKRQLETTVAGNDDLRGLGAKLHIAHGTIYEEIIEAANKLGSDLIIMSSGRPELKDYLIGPNAARVMRHAAQSVFIVRP